MTGAFCVEATIPTPIDFEGDGSEDSGDQRSIDAHGSFEPGDHRQVAVKVIDDRGNELLVVKALEQGRK